MKKIVHPLPAVMVCLRSTISIGQRVDALESSTSDCAISLSWCGKARSFPPEWMSIFSPRISDAMTEHSICQPGLPGPQIEGQEGSPGLDAFHNAKSAAYRVEDCDKAPEMSICEWQDKHGAQSTADLRPPPLAHDYPCSTVRALHKCASIRHLPRS